MFKKSAQPLRIIGDKDPPAARDRSEDANVSIITQEMVDPVAV